jgi:hypothetical protein
LFWLKLNIAAVAVTLGRPELKTLRSAHAADADVTDRQDYRHKGATDMSKKDPGGGDREERKKEELLNKLLNKSTIIITSFSVKPDNISILTTFKEIAKREAGSRGFSEVLIRAMKDYNQRHSVGNPQLLMTHYVKPEEPQPLRVLCIHCQGALTDGRVFCQKKGGMWIPSIQCYSCKNNRLRKEKGA